MNKEIIKKIKKLKEKGKTVIEISKELNINYSKALYHFNEEYRIKAIERAKKYSKENDFKRNPEKRREYHRNYQKDRYTNDPIFRNKVRERNRLIQEKKYKIERRK